MKVFVHFHKKEGPKVKDLKDSSPNVRGRRSHYQPPVWGGRPVCPYLDPPLLDW